MGRRGRRGGREGGREGTRGRVGSPEVGAEEEHRPVGEEDEPFDIHVVVHHTKEGGGDGDAHWEEGREGGRERGREGLSEGDKGPACKCAGMDVIRLLQRHT